MLDDYTRNRVTAALLRAGINGQDPVEYLHRYGLIATPAMKNKIKADTIDAVIFAIERAAIGTLFGAQLLTIVTTVQKLRQLAGQIREGKSEQ